MTEILLLTRTGTMGLWRGLGAGECSDSRSLFQSISVTGLMESLSGSGLLSLSGVGSKKRNKINCESDKIHNSTFLEKCHIVQF